ncbi:MULTISPECIES: hypothetical protein [Pseudomonas]|uniref:Uncharacterized protein n=1 Tax=Pseudomonas quercus TaxID=2722792 RepID=A0ABX0YEI6_9PSED|nr:MULTISPECIES: hypothetical protein [Pseudomonas]MBF7141915.1 hypothetical protein [Pseudomonas sp. LY10J]NJP00453.1 hypothetical protein [Pseudomonas quercus]
MRLVFPAVILLACALPLAADPMHSQYLPPDEQGLRAEAPEQQQLFQVTEFSVVAGNQRLSNQQPIPVTAPVTLRLKGKPLVKGGTLTQVIVSFDAESKSLKRPTLDENSHTLLLAYPLAQYRVLMDMLRNDQVYVQFLAYPNGHVWADLHTGSVKAR